MLDAIARSVAVYLCYVGRCAAPPAAIWAPARSAMGVARAYRVQSQSVRIPRILTSAQRSYSNRRAGALISHEKRSALISLAAGCGHGCDATAATPVIAGERGRTALRDPFLDEVDSMPDKASSMASPRVRGGESLGTGSGPVHGITSVLCSGIRHQQWGHLSCQFFQSVIMAAIVATVAAQGTTRRFSPSHWRSELVNSHP